MIQRLKTRKLHTITPRKAGKAARLTGLGNLRDDKYRVLNCVLDYDMFVLPHLIEIGGSGRSELSPDRALLLPWTWDGHRVANDNDRCQSKTCRY